jgi:hypothetical protein
MSQTPLIYYLVYRPLTMPWIAGSAQFEFLYLLDDPLTENVTVTEEPSLLVSLTPVKAAEYRVDYATTFADEDEALDYAVAYHGYVRQCVFEFREFREFRELRELFDFYKHQTPSPSPSLPPKEES